MIRSFGEGDVKKKHFFKHNPAPNYFTMTKLCMLRLDMNTKKNHFQQFWNFQFKRVAREENFGFLNITSIRLLYGEEISHEKT